MNRADMLTNPGYVRLDKEKVIAELTEALCFGTAQEVKDNFTSILRKHGMSEEYIQILLETPLNKIARSLSKGTIPVITLKT